MDTRQTIIDFRSQQRLLEKTSDWIEEFTYVGKPVPQKLYETFEKDIQCFNRMRIEIEHMEKMKSVFADIRSLPTVHSNQDESVPIRLDSC
jgi:hypothetical protein